MAAPLTHLALKVLWSRDVSWHQTLFGIFFALLLKHAYISSREGTYFHTISDGKLYNFSGLWSKSKIREVLIRDMYVLCSWCSSSFVRIAASGTSGPFLCSPWRLQHNYKLDENTGHGLSNSSSLQLNCEEFSTWGCTPLHLFRLCSSRNLSLEVELDKTIGKAVTNLSWLTKRVWENRKLTVNPTMATLRQWELDCLHK